MLDITAISFDDIELFLSGNGISVIHNKEYEIAYDLIIENNCNFYPDSIMEWKIAHHLIKERCIIPMYKQSYVQSMNAVGLISLSKLLRTSNTDVNHLINILIYLCKLDREQNNIEFLPNELFISIIKYLNIEDMIYMSETSKKFKSVCYSKECKNFIIDKPDTLNIFDFTLRELSYYLKVIPYKTKLSSPMVGYRCLLLKNKQLFYYNHDLVEFEKLNIKHNINQAVLQSPQFVIFLTDGGKLYSYDIKTNIEYEFILIDKVICISLSETVKIITASGICYEWTSGKLVKLKSKLIQVNNKYYLSETNEVYSIINNNYVKIMSDIIQITNDGYMLSASSIIYAKNSDIKLFCNIYKSDRSIKQIVSVYRSVIADRIIVLEENGDVYVLTINKFLNNERIDKVSDIVKIKNLSNIIEIAIISSDTYAALEEHAFHICNNNNIKTYDFIM